MNLTKKIALLSIIPVLLFFGCRNDTGSESRAYMQVDIQDMEAYYAIPVQDGKDLILSDVGILKTFDLPLENWGVSKLVCAYSNLLVEDEYLQKPWLALFYLIDEDGNEIYQLPVPEQHITFGLVDIKEIEVVDLDDDGDDDIVIIMIGERNSGDEKGVDYYYPLIFIQQDQRFLITDLLNMKLALVAGETRATYVGNDEVGDMNHVINRTKELLRTGEYDEFLE